jgi:hypothetical protein
MFIEGVYERLLNIMVHLKTTPRLLNSFIFVVMFRHKLFVPMAMAKFVVTEQFHKNVLLQEL